MDHRANQLSLPSEYEAMVAHETASKLASILNEKNKEAFIVDFKSENGKKQQGKEKTLTIPARAMHLLLDVLKEIAKGHAVTLVPHQSEFTTQQAADFLNVSRPFVVKLIDENKLPAHRIGRHRRIRFEDLLLYKKQMDKERENALEALTRETEALGIEY